MDRNGVCCCGDGPGESGIVMWGMRGNTGPDGRGGSVARGCWS